MIEAKLDPILEHLTEELASLRTSRATPLLVENIMVEAYQTTMPLRQLASLSVPDATSVIIRPFDKTTLKLIELAIRQSELGLNPTNEGEQLRLVVPPLTEERRTELTRLVKSMAEAARVAIRRVREETIKDIRQRQRDGELSEDERFAQEKEIQQSVDEAIGSVDRTASEKEKALTII